MMANKRKLSDDELRRLHNRHVAGEAATNLAWEQRVTLKTLTDGWKQLGLAVIW